jgi:curved DNA-binding protein CbpA
MSLKNYEILGLDENYSLCDAKSAFYFLSRQFHPDSNRCSYMSPGEKIKMFHVIETAYKQILEERSFGEFDAPTFTPVKYHDDLNIPYNDKITSLDIFNREFEKINAEENQDNPWSIHYNKSIEYDKNKNNLDILRPNEYKTTRYFEYGVNNCSDFTIPSKFTDVNFDWKYDVCSEDTESYEYTSDLSTRLEHLIKDREIIVYDEKIEEQHKEKQKLIDDIQCERRKVQIKRDLKLMIK